MKNTGMEADAIIAFVKSSLGVVSSNIIILPVSMSTAYMVKFLLSILLSKISCNLFIIFELSISAGLQRDSTGPNMDQFSQKSLAGRLIHKF